MTANPKPSSLPVLVVLAAMLSLTGVGGLWWTWIQNQEALDTARWPQTVGVITYSGIEQHIDRYGYETYGPHIEYRYVHEGAELTGDDITIAGPTETNNPNNGRELVDRFPVGKTVPVYFNPFDSFQTVLVVGLEANRQTLTLRTVVFGFLALFGLGAGVAWVVGLKKGSRGA